jgi:hypothetical protein
MTSFVEALRSRHRVTLNLSGTRTTPEFDIVSGFWRFGGKAPRALLHLHQVGAEEIACKLPPQSSDGQMRLGQLNLSSLKSPAVVGFYLMCAASEEGY